MSIADVIIKARKLCLTFHTTLLTRRGPDPRLIRDQLEHGVPRYRRVTDPPPNYKLDEAQLQDLQDRRKAARAERTRLRKQLREFIAPSPNELRQEHAELQRKIDGLDIQIQTLDDEVKAAQRFNAAVQNLLAACRLAMTINDSRTNAAGIDGGLHAAVAKYTKRIPKSQAMFVVREAFAQILDPALRDSDKSETFGQFMASVKRSRAWRLGFEKMHQEYEREAIHSVDRADRQDAIDSMKQLGELNRKQNLNPPRPRMKPKRKRKRVIKRDWVPALSPPDEEL